MSDVEVDAAASGWATAVSRLASTQAGGFSRRGSSDTWELVTGASIPLLDGVVSTAPSADPEEMAVFTRSSRLRGVDWSIQIRDEFPDRAIARIAAERGRSVQLSRDFVLKALSGDEAVAPAPVTARAWTVADAEGAPVPSGGGRAHPPAALLSMLATPSVLASPDVRAHVVEVDGEPVGTVLSVRVDDMVGIFDVAPSPSAPRDGLRRAATTAALSDAAHDGARVAFAHAAPSNSLFYLDLGFRHVETWTVFRA